MVPRRLYPWTVALLVVIGLRIRRPRPRPPSSSPGNVTQDFNPATNPNVIVTPVSSNPLNIGQSQWITNQRLGLGMEHPGHPDLLRCHDRHALRRHQHVQERQRPVSRPFGQANGDPSGTATRYDPAHLGGDKSIALAFAPVSPTSPTQPGTPVVVAGVPADKTTAGTGTDGFTVSTYNATKAANAAWPTSSARPCPSTRATWPSIPRRPIPNWSSRSRTSARFPGLIPSNGFWISAYAGSASTASRAKPTWPGRRSRPMPSRISPSRPPGWPGRWPAALAAWRFRSRRSRVRD